MIADLSVADGLQQTDELSAKCASCKSVSMVRHHSCLSFKKDIYQVQFSIEDSRVTLAFLSS